MRSFLKIPFAILYFIALFISLLSRTVNVKAIQLMEFIDKTISKER